MSIESPLFTKINEPFSCLQCGFFVPKSAHTCRDHCPRCLYSLHVDNNPGDRAAGCGGLLKPRAWSQHKKKGLIIHYVCLQCGIQKANKFLQIDALMADDFDMLLRLSPLANLRS